MNHNCKKNPFTGVAALILGVGVLVLGSRVGAHEGEEHAGAPPIQALQPDQDWRVVTAQSEEFELVAKYPNESAGPLPLRIFLSDFRTNKPVADAAITVGLSARPDIEATASPDGAPGIYRVELESVSPGEHEVVFRVAAGGRSDLLLASGLRLSASTAPSTGYGGAKGAVLLGVGGLLASGLWLWLRRRRRRSAHLAADLTTTSSFLGVTLLVIVGLSASAVPRVAAHEGESHGEDVAPAAPAPAGGVLRVSKESQFLLGIRTEPAVRKPVAHRVVAPGRFTAVPEKEAEVFAPQPGVILPPTSGKLQRLGDAVEAGQTLLIIQQVLSAPERVQLLNERYGAESEFRASRQRLDQARRDAERARKLEGVVAAKDVQQAELRLGIAEEELARTKKQADLFGNAIESGALKLFPLTAPIAGVITEFHATVGEQVDIARLLYKIIDLSTLWIDARIFEEDLAAITATKEATIISRTYPGRTFAGELVSLGQVVEPDSRTVPAIFAVPNTDGLLKVGMFAEVHLETGNLDEAVVVSPEGLFTEGNRAFVFLHVGPEEFVRREVQIRDRGPDWVAISAGLEPGERVVTRGSYQLKSTRPQSASAS